MQSSRICFVLFAIFIARATCITNSEFFQQLKEIGEVEELDTFPDKVDGDTIVLEGGPEDELNEDHLTEVLALETINTIAERAGDLEGPKSWHLHVHVRVHHRRLVRNVKPAVGTNTRCVSKNTIVKFGQPQKVTQTFCLRVSQLSKSVYHVRLVQDEHVIMDKQVLMMGPSKDMCLPYRSASNKNACMHIRLDGTSLCTSMEADFWIRY